MLRRPCSRYKWTFYIQSESLEILLHFSLVESIHKRFTFGIDSAKEGNDLVLMLEEVAEELDGHVLRAKLGDEP